MTTEQAKLLQIGDIVLLDNKVSRISYIDFDTQKDVLLMKFGSAEVFTDEDCEQIPLSQEILEKNGFDSKLMEDGVGIFHRYYYFPTNICYCEFSTVDEIQRLLRIMGFVDFANNFKV